MKKALLFLCISILFGNISRVNAQCYGVVTLDQSLTANGSSSFSISTTFANELIMISYDGWGPYDTGMGPVTVDGFPATKIALETELPWIPSGNSGTAETYAYSAPLAGVHNIVCTEPNFSNPYYDNFAASFYCLGGTTPLTVASLTYTKNVIPCNNGGSITDNITTTIPNSMIYCNAEYNEVTSATYSITWTNANFLQDTHIGYGIEASQAFAPECATSVYSITATNSMPNYNTSAFCGGLTIILVDIPPTLALNCFTATETQVNPTCGMNNGNISINIIGGVPPYTYNWTPAVTTTSSASNLSAGTYSIIVSDGSCEDTTLVVVLPGNSLNLTANVTANEKCNGNCIGAANVTIGGGTPPYTYAWTPAGGTTANATGLCAGVYTVSVTDANGCNNTVTAIITEPAVLIVTDVATNALCNGGTGSITATPAGGTAPYTYAWNPSAQTAATAVGLSAGTYTTTVTDNNGCTATTSATVAQPTALTVAVTGPLTLCANGAGTLIATPGGGTAPYIYLWSTAATTSSIGIILTTTTTYSATITDANGCIMTGTITVTLENPPTIALAASKGSICTGLSAVLTATATNVTGTFTWQPGNLTGPVVTVTPTVTTTYTVSIPSYCGVATTTITINVNQLPVTDFSVDNASGCLTPKFCAQFRDRSTSSSGNIVQWIWTFGNKDSMISNSPIYCYSKPGSYDVTLTTVTDSGCSSTLSKLNDINVYTNPVANFTMSPQPTNILEPAIQFTDKSTDEYGIVFWSWNFGVPGNDTLSSLQNPSYKYWDTGTYCVKEVVMNVKGCLDTSINCLIIDPIYSLYIPSAFTPNGDGRNEIFAVRGNDVSSFEMYIFDRWGEQLFHSKDINNGWNGTVKAGGAVCQEDTYVYAITVYDGKNKKHSYIGKLNLLR